MKFLILSCSTGEGHNSAAHALEEAFGAAGIDCQLRDPVSFQSPRAQKLVNGCYNRIIKKAPSFFGVIYRAGVWYDSTGLHSPIYEINAAYAEALWEYIESERFDGVISTHLFGMESLTAIRRKLGKSIPSYGVLTDYTVIPFFGDTELDGYFIPHEDIRPGLIAKGIPSRRIHSTGIPVSPKFAEHIGKSEARERLGIAPDKQMYVIMSGGVGGGNVSGLCRELASRSDGAEIYVMTGHNTELMERLNGEYTDGRVKALPFTREVNVYMNAADVLLSKAGGLSSTEAAVANVPLVHINAIPGCETENVRFFEKHGMSLSAKSAEEASQLAVGLASDADRAEKMREMQRLTINPHAAEDIVKAVTA